MCRMRISIFLAVKRIAAALELGRKGQDLFNFFRDRVNSYFCTRGSVQ
jgi:hypothetical protein